MRELWSIRLFFRTFLSHRLIYKMGQLHSTFDRLIIDEMELRYYPQLQSMRQMAAQKSRCVFQPITGEKLIIFAAQRGIENLGMSIIVTYLYARQGNHAYTRILEFVTNQVGQLTLNLVRNAQCAGIILRHGIPTRASAVLALQAARDFDNFVGFHLVAYLDIVKVFNRQATFKARSHFFHIVLETLQGIQFTSMNDLAIA